MIMRQRKNSFQLWIDRILSQGFLSQMGLLLVMMFLAFGLAHLLLLLSPTNWGELCEAKGISRWIAPLYLLIDGNAFTSVYEEGGSRLTVFLAGIIYIIGVFLFTGMMVSVITNIIERRVEKYQNGQLHYLRSGHYIIMGYDDSIASFIAHIFEKDPKADILILTSKPPIEVREKLLNSFNEKELRQVIINYGHRTSMEEYSVIHLESAKEVFVVGFLENKAHDAINIECIDTIQKYLSHPGIKGKPKRITCVFRDLDTYSAFQVSDILTSFQKLDIEIVPYNNNAGWARQLLTYRAYKGNNGELYHYPALYRSDINRDDDHFVHLVFIGTTNSAVAIATEAIHLLHFPNFEKDHSKRTLVTFIEKNADFEKEEFITRDKFFFEIQPYLYQDLTTSDPICSIDDVPRINDRLNKELKMTDFLDVQFQFIKGDVFSTKAQKLLSEWAKDTEHQYLSIFLAHSDQRQNFVLSMNMPVEVYDNDIPVFIKQSRSDNLITNLREKSLEAGKLNYYRRDGEKTTTSQRHLRYANLYPFGMSKTVYTEDDVYLRRAQLINYLYDTADYDTNKFKGILVLNAIPEEEIWGSAKALWRKLKIAKQWSNLYNAYSIDTKCAILRAMRGLKQTDTSQDLWPLSENEVKCLAEVEHNRWNVEELLMGYRKPVPAEDKYVLEEPEFGKNKQLLIHQDIRPFSELPNTVQELDYEFSRYIPWILKMTTH